MDNIVRKLVIFFCFVFITNVHYCQVFEYCYKEGFFAISRDNCTSFYYCARNIAIRYECPENQLFSNLQQKCVSNANLDCDVISDDDDDGDVITSTDQFTCPSEGRFPDKDSINCKSYFVCSKVNGGDLVATSTMCPSKTIFSWTENKCVVESNFICPNTITTTESSITTPVSQTTESVGFTCPSIGSHPNPDSSDCRSYYLCTKTPDEKFEVTIMQCRPGTIFSSDDKKCVNENVYQCPGMTPSVRPSTTEITSTEDPNRYNCSSSGRFPNYESTDCKTYYICTDGKDGTKASCPTNKIFSWDKKMCVPEESYICPIESSSTQSPSTTPSSERFVCTTKGRHPDRDALDCSTYKYCLLTAKNSFEEFTFKCPPGLYFNPYKSECSGHYLCPYVTTPAI